MDNKKLKVLEYFSGIGSQHKALSNLGLNFEVVGTAEWDVNAIISYDAIHTDDGIDYTKNMNKADILKELESCTFSTDGKKPCDKSKIKLDKLRQLYNANKRSRNIGDITKIKNIPIANLWTYSSPCTSISVAGKQEGLTKDSGTASSLIWDVERLLEIAQSRNELPEYLLLENVKNLVGKQFKPEFDKWISRLEEFGFNTYWKVINSKNMGIPQNRERLFAISIRKDIDDKQFQFPLPFDNGLRLKDFLEQNVDEKYYISKDKTEKLIAQLKDKQIITGQYNQKVGFKENDIACTIDACVYKGIGCNQNRNAVLENLCINTKMQDTQIREDGVCCTLISSMYKEPPQIAIQINRDKLKIKDDEICSCLDANYWKGLDNHAARTGIMDIDNQITIPCLTPDRVEKRQNGRRFKEDGDPMFTITSQDIHGVLQSENNISDNECECIGRLDNVNGHDYLKRVYSADGCSPTITTVTGGNQEIKILEPKILEDFYANRDIREYDDCPTLRADRQGLKVVESNIIPSYRIRKLTPCECLKLQAFSISDYNKCKNIGIADSNIYKISGNSITVTALMALFGELFNVEYKDKIKDIRAFYNSQNNIK